MKFKKLEQKKTFAGRGQYANALTREKAKSRLSYAEIDLGDGTPTNVFFRPAPADLMLKLQDPATPDKEKIEVTIEIISKCVVDPASLEPLMTVEEWVAEGLDFINIVASGVFGVQIIADDELGSNTKLTEDQLLAQQEELAKEPNPLNETPG